MSSARNDCFEFIVKLWILLWIFTSFNLHAKVISLPAWSLVGVCLKESVCQFYISVSIFYVYPSFITVVRTFLIFLFYYNYARIIFLREFPSFIWKCVVHRTRPWRLTVYMECNHKCRKHVMATWFLTETTTRMQHVNSAPNILIILYWWRVGGCGVGEARRAGSLSTKGSTRRNLIDNYGRDTLTSAPTNKIIYQGAVQLLDPSDAAFCMGAALQVQQSLAT